MSEDYIGPCACIGPMYGESHCFCMMMRLGIPLNEEARRESRERLKEAFDKLFEDMKEKK